MKIGHISDLHTGFLTKKYGPWTTDSFISELENQDLDVILMGGDMSEAPDFDEVLVKLVSEFKGEVYFVLGNHDFYNGSIKDVISRAHKLDESSMRLFYLARKSGMIVRLGENTALVGANGWGDGGYGNWVDSTFNINDHHCINDFIGLTHSKRFGLRKELANREAKRLAEDLESACAWSNVIILTHVPPFVTKGLEYRYGYDDSEFTKPYYYCKALGDVILKVAEENPKVNFRIYSGHTHIGDDIQITENIHLFVNPTDYGNPQVELIEL